MYFEKHEKLQKRWRGSGPPRSACRGRLQTTSERHWLKTVVVSVGGKAVFQHSQVRIEKANTSEPSLKCRNGLDDIKTGG